MHLKHMRTATHRKRSMLVGRSSGGGVRGMVQSQFEIQTPKQPALYMAGLVAWAWLILAGLMGAAIIRLSLRAHMKGRRTGRTMRRLKHTGFSDNHS